VADIRNVQIKKLEETALKHLMSEHGTKEFQVDQLLRNHKLVDLYKVAKQGLRISESSYSLKKVENFYIEKRGAEVVSAVESVPGCWKPPATLLSRWG